MKIREERLGERSGDRDEPAPQPRGRSEPKREAGWRAYAEALVPTLATFAVLAGVYLFPYLVAHFPYPTGWDAPAYVVRGQLAAHSGLDHLGVIRAGAPLLSTALARLTGDNAFTVVALLPAVVIGLAATGATALVAAALDVRPGWIPVIGVLFWIAFGENGMLNLHFDNMVNAAFTLPALAACAAYLGWRRGALAAMILLAAAGLAHWPFYALAVGILLFGLVLYVVFAWRSGVAPRDGVRRALPLAGAAAVSSVFVASTFLAISPTGWIGARVLRLRGQLRYRFFRALHDLNLYPAVPLAAAGAAVAAKTTVEPTRTEAKRFFLALMLAWVVATLAGTLAQAAGVPTAGARELHYLFPLSILTGVFIWGAARWLASRRRRALGVVASAAVVLAALGGFGALFVSMRSNDRPWFDLKAVRQAAAARTYVEQLPRDEPVVFLMGVPSVSGRPAWPVIKSMLGPAQSLRSYPYYGSIEDYQHGLQSKPNGKPQPTPGFIFGDKTRKPPVVILQRYSPAAFKETSRSPGVFVVARGVLVVQGTSPVAPLRRATVPTADTRALNIARFLVIAVVALFIAGSGWAFALLPPQATLRVALAPALGAATVTLATLAWERVGMSLSGALVPFALAAVLGWAVFALRVLPSGPRAAA